MAVLRAIDDEEGEFKATQARTALRWPPTVVFLRRRRSV